MDLTKDKEYTVFLDKLQIIETLLDGIGLNADLQIHMNIVGNKTYLLSSQCMVSAKITLQSVKSSCSFGAFSDAFTLIRKYRDDLIQYLFILETINNVKGLTQDEINKYTNKGIDFDSFYEVVVELSKILESGERKDLRDKAIDSWFQNTLEEKKQTQSRKDYFETSKYILFLKQNELIKECFDVYLDETWKKTNRILNNYVHSNGSKYILTNLIQYCFENRKNYLNEIFESIIGITNIFLSLVVIIAPSFIMATDHIDYLDEGLTPPEDSQYWVCGAVQNYIDENMSKSIPKLRDFLRDKNLYGMKIT